jgi:hypothetical protein
MRLIVKSDDADYSVECMTRARTAVLRGVIRLEHEETLERVFSAVSADLDATGTDPYTIDVSEVVFMNSSAVRALAGLVMSAQRARRRLVIVGRKSVPWQNRTLGSLSSLYDGVEIRLVAPSATPTLRRELELWAIETSQGKTLRFKDSKGLVYLDRLLSNPGRELHVLEIIGAESAGDAGPVLDERAKADYRHRLGDLREELVEAERFNDEPRATRAREEMDTIAGQLAGAVGLGGRDRRAASDAEKARVNVQRCLKETLERIANADPALGRYLAATIRTGTCCSFKPL